MRKEPYFSVIIPVHNEVEKIPLVLLELDRYLSEVDYPYEILVVDDGSTDGTSEAIKSLSTLIRHLRWVSNQERKGEGNAVRQGILEAKGKYCLFGKPLIGGATIKELAKIIPFLEEGYEVIVGFEKEPKRLFASFELKRLFENLVGLSIEFLILPGIKSTRSSIQCFSKEAAKRIFSLQRINGEGFDLEALSIAKFLGYSLKKTPLALADDDRPGRGRGTLLGILTSALKIRFWLRRNVYNMSLKEKVAN